MIGLLTAFVLIRGDAEWYWWVIWLLIEFGEILKDINKKRI
jgi:hypothetical protein